jgi:hypothetical protein
MKISASHKQYRQSLILDDMLEYSGQKVRSMIRNSINLEHI